MNTLNYLSWLKKVTVLIIVTGTSLSISLPAFAQLNPRPSIFNEPPYNSLQGAPGPRPGHHRPKHHPPGKPRPGDRPRPRIERPVNPPPDGRLRPDPPGKPRPRNRPEPRIERPVAPPPDGGSWPRTTANLWRAPGAITVPVLPLALPPRWHQALLQRFSIGWTILTAVGEPAFNVLGCHRSAGIREGLVSLWAGRLFITRYARLPEVGYQYLRHISSKC